MIGMLKKLSAVLLATVLLLSLLPLSALAAQSGDYTYTVSNGKATITGYSGGGGAVIIPSKLGGYPVTAIGEGAFYGCPLTSVVIPTGVTIIGRVAFSDCSYLTSVTIAGSVTSIGANAFELCNSLPSVTIPASVSSIEDYAFRYCYGLTAIQVNGSNTKYASQDGVLFNKVKTLLIQYPGGNARTSYAIPGTVTSIGKMAFDRSKNLTCITLPSGVISIGDGSFGGCMGLKSVTIPASVTSIGARVFDNCDALSAIQVHMSNAKFASQDGVLFDKAKTRLIQYPIGNTRTAYTIPSSVTGIEASAFAKSRNLTSVTIPSGVATIGDFAFGSCNKLTAIQVSSYNAKFASQDGSLFYKAKTKLLQYPIGNARTSYTIPASVTGIGVRAFAESVNLKSVKIPGGVTAIGKEAFAGCRGLTGIALPSGLTAIEEGVFTSCSGLSSLTIPGNITRISSFAFYSCSGLTNVTISGSVTTIGDWVFYACDKLEKAYFLGNAPVMGHMVFDGCKSNFTVCYLKGKTGFTNPWHGYPTAAITTPAAPASVKAASAGYNSIKTTWAAVSGASGYEVYRATSSSGTYSKVAAIAGSSSVAYINTGLTTGKIYYYKVRAYRLMGSAKVYSGFSAVSSARPVPMAPTGIKAARASATSVKVSWNTVAGATGYEVYRATASGGAYSLVKTTAWLNWTNAGLTTGRTYYYKVRAYRMMNGAKVYGAYSAVVSAKP